jgi:hypothetical protein
MRRLNRRWYGLAVTAVLGVVLLAACGPSQPQQKNIEQRQTTFEHAEDLFPQPVPENFPLREALVKFTERQDMLNHPWYIYILGMGGEYVGYYVGQTYPQNACNFLSSTEQIVWESTADPVVQAPSLDGVFYGGGGAASACDVYFFFDTTTDAMHTFKAPMWFATDQPLDLDLPRLGGQP